MTTPDQPPESPPARPAVHSAADASVEKPTGLGAVFAMLARLRATVASWGTLSSRRPQNKTANDLAEDRTQLAAQRTLMAADRSLMAWVRTALSMISFGFTIYKILQGLAESGTALSAAAQPRVVGLFLIGLGNLCILMGAVEYWHRARELSVYGDIMVWRPTFIMAVATGLLSLFLFVGVIFKAL